MTRFTLGTAVLFGVMAGAAWAGQVSVINPPNIVVTPPSVPSVAPPTPAPVITSTPTVVTNPTVATPNIGGSSAAAPGGVSSPVPAPIAGFQVTSMSAPQMQQAIATIDQLVASGSLSPDQAQVLTQQAQQMRSALQGQ